jgi:CBS domain containing-hemolysin-like protein
LTIAPPEGVETIGGYVMFRLGALPVPGDRVDVNGFTLCVMEIRDRRVRRVKIDRDRLYAANDVNSLAV